MKLFRSVLFWTHLSIGVLGGIVILVMSFTGVVLALRPQIQNWVDREARIVESHGASRLGPQQLLGAVKAAKPDASIQSVALVRDDDVAATVNLGREGNVFVNPYTGAITGAPSAGTSQMFQSMVSWHRYMGAAGEYRTTGRAATGASNLGFLLLGLTGLYLWWPKALTMRHLRPIIWFKKAGTGKARDFNWHNAIGFWCLIPIVIMTASGAVISYPWASDLVYRVTGTPVPPRGGPGGGRGGPGGPGGEGPGGRGGRQGAPGREAEARRESQSQVAASESPRQGVNVADAQAGAERSVQRAESAAVQDLRQGGAPADAQAGRDRGERRSGTVESGQAARRDGGREGQGGEARREGISREAAPQLAQAGERAGERRREDGDKNAAAPVREGGRDGGERAAGAGQSGRGGSGRGGERGGDGPGGGVQPTFIPEGLDAIVARAEQQMPTWSQLSYRLPNREGGPVAFTITDGAHWNPMARNQLTIDGRTAEVTQWQPYVGQNLGQRARGWMRFAHTGELGGLTGQIIAGIGCLGGVFLVYTGFALAVRRLWNWSLWKRLRASRPRSDRAEIAAGTSAAVTE